MMRRSRDDEQAVLPSGRARPPVGDRRPWTPPQVTKTRAPNGLELLTCPKPGSHLIAARLVIHTGAVIEPEDLAGVTSVSAATVTRGTTASNRTELAASLADLGVTLSASAYWDAVQFDLTVVPDRLQPAMEILAEVVRRPAFADGDVEATLEEALIAYGQEMSDPAHLGSYHLGRAVFADDTPYARRLGGTPATLARLVGPILANNHRSMLVTAKASLVLVGEIDGIDLETVAKGFGPWADGSATRQDALVGQNKAGRRILLIDRPGASQSAISMGHTGPHRSIPDEAALEALAFLLCGHPHDRLTTALRHERALTHDVTGGYVQLRHGGRFTVQTSVAPENTAEAVEVLVAEIAGARGGVTAYEIDVAREALVGRLPQSFQEVRGIAEAIAYRAVNELPGDELEVRRDELLSLVVDDVNTASEQYLDPDELAIVVVGDAKSIRGELERIDLGPVYDLHVDD